MAAGNLNTVLDIADVFHQIFGYVPAHVAGLPANQQGLPPATVAATTKKTTNLYGEPFYGAADMIGREVFCPITIEVDGKDYVFPFCVIGFRRVKTIVETEMTELNDTVDEIIGNRPWEISIKGFVIGQYDQFPDDELAILDKVFEFNQTCRLKSAVSDIFLHSNDNILIRSLEIPEKPKVIGVRDFQLTAKSSGIFTLYQS